MYPRAHIGLFLLKVTQKRISVDFVNSRLFLMYCRTQTLLNNNSSAHCVWNSALRLRILLLLRLIAGYVLCGFIKINLSYRLSSFNLIQVKTVKIDWSWMVLFPNMQMSNDSGCKLCWALPVFRVHVLLTSVFGTLDTFNNCFRWPQSQMLPSVGGRFRFHISTEISSHTAPERLERVQSTWMQTLWREKRCVA